MRPVTLGVLAGVATATAVTGIAVAMHRRDRATPGEDLAAHRRLEAFEAEREAVRERGAFAGKHVVVGRGADTYQANLGEKLIGSDFSSLGDALTAARALGDGPHAIVPFTRSLWFGDGQTFSHDDRLRFSVYSVDEHVRDAYDTYSTRTSFTSFTGGGLWIQDGDDVLALKPWDGGYSDEPVITKAATFPAVPDLPQKIQASLEEATR